MKTRSAVAPWVLWLVRAVGVVEVAGFEPVGRHGSFLAHAFAAEGDGASGPVDTCDGVEVAVEDVEVVVVAAGGHHLVADGELAIGHLDAEVDVEAVVPEVSDLVEECAGSVIEVGNVGSAGGDHDPIAIRCGEPVIDETLSQRVGVVGGHDPAVGVVGGDGLGDVPVAEVVEGVALPFVDLASVVDQHRGVGALGEGPERSAGVDLGELGDVADQHQLRPRRRRVTRERVESAGADHPGLVDNHHTAVAEDAGGPRRVG